MAEGKLGLLSRPFADTTEEVVIEIQGQHINPAVISAENGFVIRGDLQPFFEINDVTRITFRGEKSTSVTVDTSSSLLAHTDARNFVGNLQNRDDLEMLFPSNALIKPSLTVESRPAARVSGEPVLLVQITSDRGTQAEFEGRMENVIQEFGGESLVNFNFLEDEGKVAHMTTPAFFDLQMLGELQRDNNVSFAYSSIERGA